MSRDVLVKRNDLFGVSEPGFFGSTSGTWSRMLVGM